jgi:hypothetical protein
MPQSLNLLKRGSRLLALCTLLLLCGTASADESADIDARLRCSAQPSYVLCLLPITPSPGGRVTYAEAKLVRTPSFLAPVGGIAPYTSETVAVTPTLKLGFVAKQAGTAELVVLVRAVVCARSALCPHRNKVVRTTISVPKKHAQALKVTPSAKVNRRTSLLLQMPGMPQK